MDRRPPIRDYGVGALPWHKKEQRNGTLGRRHGMDRVWHGYEFDAACTGEFGEVYLGESDRIGHLFLYFPPVRKR